MNEHPDTFIAIELHINDHYRTPWTVEQSAFYGVAGTPTTWFDGVEAAEGAFTNELAMTAWYGGILSNELEVPTDVSVTMSAVATTEDTFAVTVDVLLDQDAEARELVGHVVQVLDHYPASDDWFRNTVIQHQETAPFTLDSSRPYSFTMSFTLSGDSWNYKEDAKFVAWVSDVGDSAPLPIHNAAQLAWPFEEEPANCDQSSSSRGLLAAGAIHGLALGLLGWRARGRRGRGRA